MENKYIKPWMTTTLFWASLYNIGWGLYILLAPEHYWIANNIQSPLYPSLWQGVGVFIIIFGISYYIASLNIKKHWPLILMGLLAKISWPALFLYHYLSNQLPLSFGYSLIANDIIWWAPFILILRAVYLNFIDEDINEEIDLFESAEEALEKSFTNNLNFLKDLSFKQPVLLMLMRHHGCTFCKEALSDLKNVRSDLENKGFKIVLVHMSQQDKACEFFKKYKLDDLEHISDPHRVLYKSIGLCRGRLSQLLGLNVIFRGFSAALKGHFQGRLEGDAFQMPGLFLIKNGTIIKSYQYNSAASKVDFLQFASV